MLTLRKVAITGGLASGKTSVCQILKDYGAYVVNADEIVHQLLSPNTAAGQKVIDLLGAGVSNGQILDRSKIAQIVFSDPEKLLALEEILHPAVFEEIEKQYCQIKDQAKYSLFVAEIPLFYEYKNKNCQDFFDTVVAVTANPAICKSRFRSKDEYDKRMQRQCTQEEKTARADFTIVNNGDMEQLKQNVINLFLKELHPQ